jgi:hypothetical protein
MRASLLSILGFAVLTASSSLAQMQDNRGEATKLH